MRITSIADDFDMDGDLVSTRPNAAGSSESAEQTLKRKNVLPVNGDHYEAMVQMKDLVEKYRRDVDVLSGELTQAREENNHVRTQSNKTKKSMEKRERELEVQSSHRDPNPNSRSRPPDPGFQSGPDPSPYTDGTVHCPTAIHSSYPASLDVLQGFAGSV